MEQVTSRENRQVKELAALLGHKKERERTGLFVAEGLRLCADAARRCTLRKVYLTPGALARYPQAEQLAGAAPQTILLEESLAARIADTRATQGIFCVCEKLDNSEFAVTIKPKSRYLLLSDIQDPGNLGACIRTAGALGVDGLILNGCCELYSPKTLRASMGSAFYAPIRICTGWGEVLAAMEQARVPVYAAALTAQARTVDQVDFSGGGAVLIGNEGNGLPQELINACTGSVIIPMDPCADSLNAAVAAAILTWEMTRPTGRQGGPNE